MEVRPAANIAAKREAESVVITITSAVASMQDRPNKLATLAESPNIQSLVPAEVRSRAGVLPQPATAGWSPKAGSGARLVPAGSDLSDSLGRTGSVGFSRHTDNTGALVTSMSDVNSQIVPSLDGIRGLSVLIVVLGHSGFDALVPGGLGVTIFFFLSGYLITTLMLAERDRAGRIIIWKFYARRMLRLMPALFLSLAIAYGLTYAGLLPGGITNTGLAAQLLYFANYYGLFFDPGNTIPDGTGILWSLAVEEHFYIFYPLFMTLLLGIAFRPRTIGALLGIGCLVVLAWRIHLVQSPNFMSDRTYYASDTRIDSIIYGCMLALIVNPKGQLHRAKTISVRQWVVLAIAAGTLLLTLLYRGPAFRETIRYSLQGLALMPLFYFAVRFSKNQPFRHLNSPFAIALGSYSYAIYLIHYVVIKLIAANAPAIAARSFILFPTALLISIAYAAAVDRFVDSHFRLLRHKYRAGTSHQKATCITRASPFSIPQESTSPLPCSSAISGSAKAPRSTC
jgi:peptidoglycan/LPS O-acetylase OafA/YrhL